MDAAELAGVQTSDWAILAIVEARRRMDQPGWVPAIAGNISVRLDADRFVITRNCGYKGASMSAMSCKWALAARR